MKIDVQNLHSGPLTITLNHSPKYFDLTGEGYKVIDNIQGELTFSLIKDKVLMRVFLHTHIRMDCIRCLKPMDIEIKKHVDLYYLPQNREKGKEEVINLEELETSYFHGLTIIPDNDIQELILIELPDYPHCREDCKGLCVQCGKDLNIGSCSCNTRERVSFSEEKSWKDRLKNIHS